MIGRIANGLASILGAGSLAQFPEYYRQYVQRLGGRLDQAQLDVKRLLEDAQTLGRTLEAYLNELLNSGTLAARQAAQRELERVENADQLEQAYQALVNASPFERPFQFVQHFDPAIAEETFKVFAPAVPVTPEGFVYAGIGMILALVLLAGGERGGRAMVRRVTRKRRPAEVDQRHV